MLHVELDCPLEFLVILVAFPQLEVHQDAVVIVKRKQLLFLRLIRFQLLLKCSRVASNYELCRRAIVALICLWHVFFDSDALCAVNNIVLIVTLVTASAFMLGLLDVH